MAGTLCLSGDVVLKAGVNVATLPTDADYDSIINQAEALISAVSRYDWVANYGTVETNFKPFLREVTSDIAAIYAINYDASGIITASSIREEENRIVVLRDAALRGLSLVRDKKLVTFGD